MESLVPATRGLVAALYAEWTRAGRAHPADWLDLFRLAEDDATQRGILLSRGAALSALVGAEVEGEDAQHGAILAVQTAVAIAARLVALRVTEGLVEGGADGSGDGLLALADGPDAALLALADAPDAALLDAVSAAGETLADRGVDGILEGDPFAAYGISPAIAAALRRVVAEVGALSIPTAGDDLFAALTQAVVPAAVRHALGEFYTPAWLADVVVDTALAHARAHGGAPAAWRGLDPCCGSGAFVLALARRVLAETVGLPRAERLRAVLDRVSGVDLHPLAVLTARVNLLVVIAPLLQRGDRARIGIHRGDATRPDSALGRFTLLVGNPPWVDWKRLPPAQRAALRESRVARDLYSGDGLVGGVSLNVCAVVARAGADAWLADGGVMGLLMPRSLAVQPSYAAFRAMRRADGGPSRIVGFDDWSGVGHPFAPVTERFLTWYVAHGCGEEADSTCVPVIHYRKRLGTLERHAGLAAPMAAGSGYAWAADHAELRRFAAVAGECAYVGREGVEFYPQEVWLFEVLGPSASGRVRVRNFQGGKSRYRVPARELELEADWLHPLVKGVDVGRFRLATPRLVVPFPYAPGERLPVPMSTLRDAAPLLAAWLAEHAPLLAAQTPYNARILGRADAEAHALARVGRYSFARAWVAFRDNTSWGATVVTEVDTEWGGARLPRFQNHAVSMCERADGGWITEDEAHYVCAALNAPLVRRLLAASSDARSFKIRPPVRVPLYDADDATHRALGALSRRGHAGEDVDEELDGAYLAVLG
ncbi:MAG: N-6 DNA methylase [Pseudomonadota bacterium]|nr:N-6 DNA methylase [Pseudomonadota bacterium]